MIMDTAFASIIGIFIAVLGGYLKQKYGDSPEAFQPDKLIRTIIVALIWSAVKVLGEQYGLPIVPDPFIQGLLDSGMIAIFERWLLVFWRKILGP